MEELIPIINKLQDVFNVLDDNPIGLPQIVVIGAQSSGKSSVLESIVGKDFLPRGIGIVTRRPLLLQLIHVPRNDTMGKNSSVEYGEFLHLPNEKFYNFNEIRNEISKETERLAGHNKGISSKPIILKIFSEHVLNLTMIDLPGITKLPVGDQPENIEQQIVDLVLSHITGENVLILAVSAANTDLANSDALKLAKQVDPNGKRTIGVCTKLDLMDAGTDAMDVLEGRVIPVQLGFIGVVNRSQKDINDGLSMNTSKMREEKYFQTHPIYSRIAERSGINYLSRTLNKILMEHIKKSLPMLKIKISEQLQLVNNRLDSFGAPVLENIDKGSLLLHHISNFSSDFLSLIDGTFKFLSTTELIGGARISYIFHETFGSILDHITALEGLENKDIQLAIRNATGARRALFVPEICFELLVKKQISRLLDPSLHCAELIYDELCKISNQCISLEIQRYEGLHRELKENVIEWLKSRLEPTTALIKNIIGMELAYINTNHPDFIGGQNAINKIFNNIAPQELIEIDQNTSINQSYNYLNKNTITRENEKSVGSIEVESVKEKNIETVKSINTKSHNLTETKKTLTKTSSFHPSDDTKKMNLDKKGWFNHWFTKHENNPNTFHSLINSSTEESPTLHSNESLTSFSPRDCLEIQLIRILLKKVHSLNVLGSLIFSYFRIVCKNVQDNVPKAIMLLMVNYVKENLQSYLISSLYHQSKFDLLLNENSFILNERKQLQLVLQSLKRASNVINEISFTKNISENNQS